MSKVTIVKEPIIIPIAEMGFIQEGLQEMVKYLWERRPECLDGQPHTEASPLAMLLPHGGLRIDGSPLTDNEMLIELSGRTCYYSFGQKAGRLENESYLKRMMGEPGKIPHSSVFYHAKMTFFFAGISRRVSHELIRHYVGADRSEEGSPSQESTRYTHHPGWFCAHPRDLEQGGEAMTSFEDQMSMAYDSYLAYLRNQVALFKRVNDGKEPKGMDRKRIYESASMRLPHSCATSFVWTTNPIALQKLLNERLDFAADLEIQRFARHLRNVAYKYWGNMFPQNKVEEWRSSQETTNPQ